MKKITTAFSLIIAVALTAFKPAPVTYKVDTEKSKIEWTGKKVLGQHTGTIKLASGEVMTNGKVLNGGNFVIDMKSMANTDLTDAKSNAQLMGHLKSDDFFGVEKYPTAEFKATKIVPVNGNTVNVTGNLTIKGKTEAISFPANYNVINNTLTVTALNVKVNRTKYDIKYGSKSFFESIGDKAIDDDFLLNINLVAAR